MRLSYLILFTCICGPVLAQHHENITQYRLDSVNISARHKKIRTAPGIVSVSASQIRDIPAFMGEADLLKALQLLPGVQSGGDGNVGLYVRGGNFDQNMILMDHVVLYNPEHLKGFASAFNEDIAERIVFYKGSFPSEYGGRLSGIVEVENKEGNTESYHGKISVGILSSKIYAEGPIIKNKTSFLAAARGSYFNWIAKPVLNKVYDRKQAFGSFADMNYYDMNAKLSHLFSPKDKISLSFYYGKDYIKTDDGGARAKEMNSDPNGDSGYQIYTSRYDTDNHWGNIAANLKWNHNFSNRLQWNNQISYSKYDYTLAMTSFTATRRYGEDDKIKSELSSDTKIKYISDIKDVSFRSGLSWIAGRRHLVSAGLNYTYNYLHPRTESRRLTYSYNADEDREKRDKLENINEQPATVHSAAFYAEDDMDICRFLKLNAGIRGNLYNVPGKTYVFAEPRLNISFSIRKDLSVKAAYTYMSQPIHRLESSNIVLPSDIWLAASRNLPPMHSSQYSMGIFYSPGAALAFSLEGYYKTMQNVLEYKEGGSAVTQSSELENMVSRGKGRSYGIEFLARKNTGKTTGWISYTWSKSLRKFDRPGDEINNGIEFYAANDCRNNFAATLTHRFNKHWQISGTFIYRTGKKGTLPDYIFIGRYPDDSWQSGDRPPGPAVLDRYEVFKIYTEKNGFRMPAYHRLDVGCSYKIYHKTGCSSVRLGFYNLYNRLNAYSVYPSYENDRPVLKQLCLFPFMPSVSYAYEF